MCLRTVLMAKFRLEIGIQSRCCRNGPVGQYNESASHDSLETAPTTKQNNWKTRLKVHGLTTASVIKLQIWQKTILNRGSAEVDRRNWIGAYLAKMVITDKFQHCSQWMGERLPCFAYSSTMRKRAKRHWIIEYKSNKK